MTKISPLTDIQNLQSETTVIQAINSNNSKIETALENTVSRDGSSPNAMSVNFDVGLNRIINVGVPIDPNDAVRYQDLQLVSGALDPSLIAMINAVAPLAEQVADDAAAAHASAIEAAGYVGAATSAPKWTTARTITLSGPVTGSQTFDGTANFTVTTTIGSGAITSSMLASGVSVSNIGYTPANLSGDTFVGDVKLNFSAVALTDQSIGFRGAPRNTQNGDYVFTLNDSGKMVWADGGTNRVYYVPTNTSVAFPVGTVIIVRVQGSGQTTIAPADGSVGVRLGGSSVSGNKVCVQWSLVSLLKEDTNAWVVTGTGVS